MNKVLLACCFLIFMFTNAMADGFYKIEKQPSKENYPIKEHHQKIGLECKNCHTVIDETNNQVSRVSTSKCLECHGDYKKLANATSDLGYDDNIHASPHYPDMDCKLCHASHKKSQNYCVMCHSQDSLKNLLVP